jgi:hypothetical protein
LRPEHSPAKSITLANAPLPHPPAKPEKALHQAKLRPFSLKTGFANDPNSPLHKKIWKFFLFAPLPAGSQFKILVYLS